MRESKIEAYLKQQVEAAGGMCLKFVSPGTAGVPDRLVLMPGGKMGFVELKRPGVEAGSGSTGALQNLFAHQARARGFGVYRINSHQEVQSVVVLLGNEKAQAELAAKEAAR